VLPKHEYLSIVCSAITLSQYSVRIIYCLAIHAESLDASRVLYEFNEMSSSVIDVFNFFLADYHCFSLAKECIDDFFEVDKSIDLPTMTAFLIRLNAENFLINQKFFFLKKFNFAY
jgi:hypothetical protein